MNINDDYALNKVMDIAIALAQTNPNIKANSNGANDMADFIETLFNRLVSEDSGNT